MEEIWKDVVGYEGLYKVSSYGRIKSIKLNEELILKQNNMHGYKSVCLNIGGIRKGMLVHRLVAIAFIENINNLSQVNHKDEDKINNNLENLEWCTAAYNNNYGTRVDRAINTVLESGIRNREKTFPLQFTEEYLNEIRCKAEGQNKTIKQFILDAIEKEMRNTREK